MAQAVLAENSVEESSKQMETAPNKVETPVRRDTHPLLSGYGAFTDSQVAEIEALAERVAEAVAGAHSLQRVEELRQEFVFDPALQFVRVPRERKFALIGRMIDHAACDQGEGGGSQKVSEILNIVMDKVEAVAERLGKLEARIEEVGSKTTDTKTDPKKK